MFASAHPMGHFSAVQMKTAMMNMGVIQMEMERMKMMPGQMIEDHLDCLNKLIEPLAITQGVMGMRAWLQEVQWLMTAIKQRSFSGVPLMPRERQVLVWYSQQWRELRGGPCDMGLPEAQVVLIAMGELAMF